MSKLYSVAINVTQIYQVRVVAESEEDAKVKAAHKLSDALINDTHAEWYVGQSRKVGPAIEVPDNG